MITEGQASCENAKDAGVAITIDGVLVHYQNVGYGDMKLWTYPNGKIMYYNSNNEAIDLVNIIEFIGGYDNDSNLYHTHVAQNTGGYGTQNLFSVTDNKHWFYPPNDACENGSNTMCAEYGAVVYSYTLPQSTCNFLGMRFPSESEITSINALKSLSFINQVSTSKLIYLPTSNNSLRYYTSVGYNGTIPTYGTNGLHTCVSE